MMQFFALAVCFLAISAIHAGSKKLFGHFLISQFALVKYSLEQVTGLKSTHEFIHTLLIVIPSFLLTVILTVLSSLLVLVLWLYKQTANVILQLTLGENYRGLVTGCNITTTLLEGKERGVVTVLIVFDFARDGQEFFKTIKNRLKEKLFKSHNYNMLLTVRKFFMNYMYLYKESFELDEIVKKIDAYPTDVLTKENLVDYMNKHCHMDLPKSNSGNFDVLVGTQPLHYPDANGLKQYPVLIRIHHLIADGFIMYNIIADIFCEQPGNDEYAEKFLKKPKKNKQPFMKLLKIGWEKVCKTNIRAVIPSLYKPNLFIDDTIPKESDTIMSYCMEEEEKYVDIAKNIRQRVPGVPFLAVVVAAFSASLAEYFGKHSKPDDIPEVISAGLPIQMHSDRLTQVYSKNGMNVFENDFSVFYMNVPIVPKGKKDVTLGDYMLDRLLITRDEFQDVAKSADTIVNYMLMKVYLSVLPWSLSRFFLRLGKMTVAISTIPGGPTRKTFYNTRARDVLFFIPKQQFFGLAFTALTYENRFQLGLKGNKDMLHDVAAVDEILNGVFKYLDILDEKTKDLVKA